LLQFSPHSGRFVLQSHYILVKSLPFNMSWPSKSHN
jgi:hypothetical protein